MDVKITKTDGDVIAINNVASVETDPPMTAPPAETTTKLLKITDTPYGASPNADPAANATAIQKCYDDAKKQGAQVEIPAGKYRYSKTLIHDGIQVFNNGELQGTAANVGYYMRNTNIKLIGGTLSHEGNTVRGGEMFNHGIGLYDQSGEFELIDVHIVNPAGAGICIWDGRDGRIVGCTVEDSLADGIHHVASSDGTSGRIYERGNVIKRAGDDCLSFVTYGTGAQPVHDVEVWDFRGEDNTWGRGITLLGAKNIVINGAILNRIFCFGVFCGVESNFGGAGSISQGVLNDVKIETCGSWSQSADVQDGVLISGWLNSVSLTLNNCVISHPKRHGVLRYHAPSNEFVNNNTIFHEVGGEEIHTVGEAQSASYGYPSSAQFKSPKDSKAN